MIEASEKPLWNTRILSCMVLQLLTPINSIDSCDQGHSMSSQGCDLDCGQIQLLSIYVVVLSQGPRQATSVVPRRSEEDQTKSFQRDHHSKQYFGFVMSSQFLV